MHQTSFSLRLIFCVLYTSAAVNPKRRKPSSVWNTVAETRQRTVSSFSAFVWNCAKKYLSLFWRK